MSLPLSRLIEGIIATMRSDVIPNVSDPFARGQAIGVIDLLNNIAPRVEWSQAPLQASADAKAHLLADVASLVPDLELRAPAPQETGTAEGLLALHAGLDAALGNAIASLWPRRGEAACGEALRRIKAHLHDEASAELKKTRKPLFAEIASGDDGKAKV